MASSKTAICNLALSHLGQSKLLANVDTDRTVAALAFRTFYDQVIDEVLRDFSWPFARRFDDLELVEDDPTTEWSFSYRMPANCVFFKRILSGQRRDTDDSKVPYWIGRDDTGQLIYTDAESAVGEWTHRVTDVTQFDADFVAAVALLLAGYSAASITGGDDTKLGDRCMNLYANFAGPRAKANAANEEQVDREADSDFIRARRGP